MKLADNSYESVLVPEDYINSEDASEYYVQKAVGWTLREISTANG